MYEFFGPVEKAVLGFLVLLFGIYFALDHYSPALFNPELNKVSSDPLVAISARPREGQVVPVSGFSESLSGAPSIDRQDGFVQETGGSGYDPKKINWFAKGVDGLKHPANSFLVGFSPFYTQKYWLPLLAVSLRVRYMRDDEVIKDNDTWQTSLDTYTRRWGDCEDHAILLADWMIDLGYDARVVAGTVNGKGHAWVVLFKDGKEYLLESTDKGSRRSYPLVELHPEYVPEVMFNRDRFWAVATEHRGWRDRLSTKSWVELSRFTAGP